MPQGIDANTITDLEKQVDDAIKAIDGVLKAGGDPGARRGPKSDDADMTGAGKHNTSGHQRPSKSHTHQPGSPTRNMVPVGKSLDDAAEMLGIDKALLEKALAKASKSDDDDDDDDDDMDKRLSQAAELLGMEKSGLLSILAKASKSDDEDDDDDDDDASNPGKDAKKALDQRLDMASAMLGVSKEDLSAILEKSASDGDTVVIEGHRISKAEVGEGVFEVLKSQSDKIAKSAEALAKAEDKAKMSDLSKRADTEFSHVPGSTAERAEMLKALEGMSEPVRKSFEKVLTHSEKIVKGAFDKIGVQGGDPDMQKSRKDFEKKVAEIKKRDECSQTEAMSKARQEDPEGFKAYNGN